MFTASVDFSEQDIEELIDRTNTSFGNLNQKSKANSQELDILLFELSANDRYFDKEDVKANLLTYNFIKYVAFGNDAELKIGALENTPEADVLDALNAVGIEVR